jgi:basic membrane protein A
MSHYPNRRDFLALTGGIAGSTIVHAGRAQSGLKVAALFAGKVDDGGFMEAGYRGLLSARDKLNVAITWRDQIKLERDLLLVALRELTMDGAALVVAHGGRTTMRQKLVASEFPGTKFVVTQGNVTGPNLASYEVLQEESAFLAGALAGWINSNRGCRSYVWNSRRAWP